MEKCCIWTRVSTKYQENNGGSLETQKEECLRFAKEHGMEVVNNGYFGGSHETAKTPGRFITDMISAIKRGKIIKYVIVSQIDRFSRNAGQGITMFHQLLGIGVTIVEASTGLKTSDLNDRLMLQFKLCMAEWDNENRTDKFTKGRIGCLQSGVYCGAVPLGYDKEGKSRNRTFSINQTGELIRLAYQWKLQGMANCQIIERLKPLGLTISKQTLHKILTNPFYAGKIRHKMLNYEIIDGNQPPIITYADFLKVQEILSGRTGVYQHKKETSRYPLKRHVYCAHDKSPMTAYTVKKKNIDYYKCNCVGCKTNVSAKKLHIKYVELLSSYDIPQPLVGLVRHTISSLLSDNQTQLKKRVAILKKQRAEKTSQLNTCKTRYGVGKIDDDVFNITVSSLQADLDAISLELSKYDSDLSNLDSRTDDVLVMCCHIDKLWKSASIQVAQKLQNLLFPDGILWDKETDSYRTINENSALAVIRKISDISKKTKEENPCGNSSLDNECA